MAEDPDMSTAATMGGGNAKNAKIATKSVCAEMAVPVDPILACLATWSGDLIGRSLCRLYQRCVGIPALADRARRHVQGRLGGYDPGDCVRRYAAQLEDLVLLSQWLVVADVS